MANAVVEISLLNSRHSRMLVFLTCLLKIAADHRDSGAVLGAPFVMKCDDDIELMPDLQFVTTNNIGLITDDCLAGPADIAVEVIAFGSDPAERESNLPNYEKSGVAEYWLIDPEYRIATFCQRGADNKLAPGRVGEAGIYRSKVLPHFWLKVQWIFDLPSPKALVIMREWRII
jgi:Uma2 family endonuclease